MKIFIFSLFFIASQNYEKHAYDQIGMFDVETADVHFWFFTSFVASFQYLSNKFNESFALIYFSFLFFVHEMLKNIGKCAKFTVDLSLKLFHDMILYFILRYTKKMQRVR